MVLWRRVETITPEAYAQVIAWLEAADGELAGWPGLASLAINETIIDVPAIIAELERLLARSLADELAETIELLRDLIWEASDTNSDWLSWRACRVCGRRWAATNYCGTVLCPRHANPNSLSQFLRAEMQRYNGLLDYSDRLAELAALPPPVLPARPPLLSAEPFQPAEGILAVPAAGAGVAPDDQTIGAPVDQASSA
jgi:hypothetical protein